MSIHEINEGDKVWSTCVLGVEASCENPPYLFSLRHEEFIIKSVSKDYNGRNWYELQKESGGGTFHVRRNHITKIKPFSWLYTDWEKERDREMARSKYGSWW